MWQNNNIGLQEGDPGRVRAILNSKDSGQGYINDFRATLQLGYRDYISTLSHWLRERLGLGLRTQVSYNLPMEMGVNIPFVDVPECESLGFGDSIDGYHQFMGPAALAGKRVVSNEMGAVFLAVYKHDIPRLVHQSDLAFAAGNNRLVLHGLAFGGNYSATTWPGHSAFNYFVVEMHSQKHPSWQAGMPEAMEYLARTQFVMHEGFSRADVAIYHHVSGTDPAMPRLYKATDLETAGFSYLYIAPDNLRYDTARVKNGILGPDTASFRALILMPGAAMSPQSAKDLIELAEDGLPILIAEDPVAYLSSDGSDKSDVLDAIKMLKALPSVDTIANGTAAAILRSLDINPFVGTQVNNGTWITNRRHDARRAIDYVFLLGAPQATSGEIVIQTTGIPYIMDAWTGTISPVLHYTRSSDGTSLTIPVSLGPDETVMFAFSKEPLDNVLLPDSHIAKMSPSLTAAYSDEDGLILPVPAGSESVDVELSTGETVQVDRKGVAESFAIADWDLTVEHWEAPTDLYDIDTIAIKHNTTHTLTGSLKPWTELAPSLRNASGMGYYSSSFEWDAVESDGAYLSLTKVLHAVGVFVNGRQTDAVDPRNPVVDISSHLQDGQNEVLIMVPSLMWNYVRRLMPELEMAGTRAFTAPQFSIQLPLPGPVGNRLVGDVVVTPYKQFALEI